MTSEEALYLLMTNQKKVRDGFKFINLNTHEKVSIEECYDIVVKDLDRLEELEKVVDFLKLNFDISLDSKLRISDGSECVQTFITYLPENTTIDEMFKTLKEVLENDK